MTYDLEQLQEKYGDYWNDEVLLKVKEVLKEDKEVALEWISSIHTYEDGLNDFRGVFELLKENNQDLSFEFAISYDFSLTESEVEEIIKHPEFKDQNPRHIQNSNVKEVLEQKFLEDDELFQESFGGLDGQGALRKIAQVSAPLGKKIFEYHKKEILQRFSKAGQDESRYIKDIIELGILDEKEFKRAIKRMVKQSSHSIPLLSVIESGFYSNEEILEIAEEKGLSHIKITKEIPEYVYDFMIKRIGETDYDTYLIGYMFGKDVLNKEQRLNAIKILDAEKTGEYYKHFLEEEKEIARKNLLEKFSEGDNLDPEELDLIAKDDKKLAMSLLENSIKGYYRETEYVSCEIITGELVYKIFEKNKKDNALQVVKKGGLKKLKEAGLDQRFAEEALSSANKKELKELSSFLMDYIPEEERLKIEANYVKSVSGAIDYFKQRGTNPKIRAKALARISSSLDALVKVIAREDEELLSVEELEKLITYSKVSELLFSRDGKNVLNKILSKISRESLNNFFKLDFLVFWDLEFLNKVDGDKIIHATKEIMDRGNSRTLVSIEMDLVADTYIKFMNKEQKEFLLGEHVDSFTGKKYIESLKKANKEIPVKYQFAYKAKPNKKDFDYAIKFLKNKEEEYPKSYIEDNLNDFFSKWSEDQVSILLNHYILGFGELELSILDKAPSFRKKILEEFEKIAKENMVAMLKEAYNDRRFQGLEEEELAPFCKIISQNKEALAHVIENWSEETLNQVLPIDQLVRMILNQEISPDRIPKDFGKRISLQAVRQQNKQLINLVLNSAGLEEVCSQVQTDQEARVIVDTIENPPGASGDYYWYRRGYHRASDAFSLLKEFDLKEEISSYILKKSRNASRNQQQASFLVKEYQGRFDPSIISSLLRALDVKAEIKRVVEVLLDQGFENEVYSIMLENTEKYEEIFPKSFIKKMYTPEILSNILDNNPSLSEISIVLNFKPDVELLDKAVRKSLDLKYCKVYQEEEILKGKIGQYDFFSFNTDNQRLKIEIGSDALTDLIMDYLKVFIELVDTSGLLDFSTKTITKSDGKIFDLKQHNVVYRSENESKLEEIFGLISFGIPIKVRARIQLSQYGSIICRVDFDEKEELNPKMENTEIFDKIMAQVEKKAEDLETNFLEILGKINKDHPFGIEMEFSSAFKRPTIADKLNRAAGDKKIEGEFNALGLEGYSRTTGDNWEIKYDSSIKVDNIKRFAAEVVSPKLYGEEGLKQLEQVVMQLEKMGKKLATGVEQHCGIHVHHDLKDILDREKDLEDIARAFYSIQEPLYAICHRDRSEDGFCSKLYFSEKGLAYDNRHGGFNMRTGHGTIEFRMKEGAVDPKAIVRWVRLTKSIVDEVRVMYKENTIKMKRSMREGFSKIFEAIIVEKSLQIKEDKGINYMNAEETQRALLMSQMLLGEMSA